MPNAWLERTVELHHYIGIFRTREFNLSDVQDQLNSTSKNLEMKGERNIGKSSLLYAAEELKESLIPDDYGQHNPLDQGLLPSKYQEQEVHQQSVLGYGLLNDLRLDIPSPPLQTCLEEIAKLHDIMPTGIQDVAELNKDKQYPGSFGTFELLKIYGNTNLQLDNERRINSKNEMPVVKQELSSEEIMRIASARFIRSSTEVVDVASILNNPSQLSLSGLSNEDAKKVELAELLIASAEKAANQQFDHARTLLNQCDLLSSNTGNPVQRIVYYFCKAILERIDHETGTRMSINDKAQSINMSEVNLAFIRDVPFSHASAFAGIQAVAENVTQAKRIHVIDLQIRTGQQWIILMQALASQCESPIEHLKITAIGTTSRQLIEDTGKRLMSFAQTMNLPFSFKIVMISDMLDLKVDHFELDAEEPIAVYAEFALSSLIAMPHKLEALMKVIKDINPYLMVVTEVEANHNSPVYVNRFVEALFFVSAFFDCLDACMRRDDPNRTNAEAVFFGERVRNMVATEGEERIIRNVKIDVWRAFFARFGMVETELSMSSSYQANLVLKKFPCGNFCTLHKDGKSLIIGWKGTPIHCLSIWEFR